MWPRTQGSHLQAMPRESKASRCFWGGIHSKNCALLSEFQLDMLKAKKPGLFVNPFCLVGLGPTETGDQLQKDLVLVVARGSGCSIHSFCLVDSGHAKSGINPNERGILLLAPTCSCYEWQGGGLLSNRSHALIRV